MIALVPAAGIDQAIDDVFGPFATWLESIVFFAVPIAGTKVPLIVGWLVVCGFFFTIWLRFLNVRGLKHAVDLVRGKFTRADAEGEVTHFQALATAVSGTVGLGNIAGVAVAMSLGGPGAAFWMTLCGFLGMSTKMAECMLAVKYRKIRPDGSVSGGPMYYLRDGLAEIGHPGVGKVLSYFWAICILFGALAGGNAFQSNQAAAQIVAVTGGDQSFFADKGWLIGVLFAIAAGAVIIGGIKSIARVTEKIVPFMGVVYVLACLVVIVVNIDMLPGAVGAIFAGAFAPEGIAGGIIGALIVGFQRAAFSNEAGLGSAAVAHSPVKTDRPATEGFVASLEPFIDTIIVCNMTALAIIITDTWNDGDAGTLGGIGLTSRAFETVLPWFPIVLAFAVVLFAFSTMISYSYYGMKGTGFLFGDSRLAENVFKVVFLLFTVLGAAAGLKAVITFSDCIIFLMSLGNILGLYFLAKVIRREFDDYRAELREGRIEVVAPEERIGGSST
ncbi:alanine/glycine:cation symporter family protein [Agilicoccus flavus]|uniref:alanine/glycine:cation symporter family protein n=1 Tax=Agilicoccus flavus TaxID=2775968 RepID=UPI001CF71CB4|nr:alanine/glycine:cation symporter family protein [Agilicoccus flavus]